MSITVVDRSFAPDLRTQDENPGADTLSSQFGTPSSADGVDEAPGGRILGRRLATKFDKSQVSTECAQSRQASGARYDGPANARSGLASNYRWPVLMDSDVSGGSAQV
jgi:hypothetical protein